MVGERTRAALLTLGYHIQRHDMGGSYGYEHSAPLGVSPFGEAVSDVLLASHKENDAWDACLQHARASSEALMSRMVRRLWLDVQNHDLPVTTDDWLLVWHAEKPHEAVFNLYSRLKFDEADQ